MNRRTFLSSVTASADRAHPEPEQLLTEPPSLEPYDGAWDRAAALHLLRRTIVAPSRSEVDEALAGTLDGLIDRLTHDDTPIPGPPRYVGEWMNAELIAWDSGRVDVATSFFDELRRWWFGLMVNGAISLRERMTLFWHNHFANNATLVSDARFMYMQNQLFRRNALGNFREMVRAVTLDKAMLEFLNGKGSTRGYSNENYARELQELFTIGIADNDGNANYTQRDIVAASLALTGWDWLGLNGAVTSNLLTGHDPSDKQFYGETIAGNGDGGVELDRLLDLIFAKEETARYVIRKIYRFFVYTDAALTPVRPIDAEVERNVIAPLAADFRASNWEIGAVLRRLLRSRHFFDPGLMGGMIKSPVDLFAGLLRSTRTAALAGDQGDYAMQIAQSVAKDLGQDLFHPPGVQGWQFHRSWVGTTTLPERNRATDAFTFGMAVTITDRLNPLFSGPIERKGSFGIDLLAFAKGFPSFTDPHQLVADIAAHMLAYPASAALLARLEQEMVGDRGYEWNDIGDELRAAKLQAMVRVLMRSANYQLM
jgi:uncharacterized protein (DUF1800 family)